MENNNIKEEFEEIRIKCEYISPVIKEEIESEPLDNFFEDNYKLTKHEKVFYTCKFNGCCENFDSPNFADCLDTKNFDKTLPENESDYSSISESSTSSGKLSLKEWNPTTRLGRMVKKKKYKSIKEILQNDLTISEESIVNFLLGPALSFEVLYVKPLFDQCNDLRGYLSCACVGDRNGHFGYSIKYDALREVSIQGSINRAMINILPIKRLSYIINNKKFYTVARSVTGRSGVIRIKLKPKFNNIKISSISNNYIRSMLSFAGIDNCIVKIIGYHPSFGKIPLAAHRALMKLHD